MSGDLSSLNAPDPSVAEAKFLTCCASKAWAQAMTLSRPFANEEALFREADRIWFSLPEADQLEAFAGHPEIGGADALREKFQSTRAWSEEEQRGVREASDETIRELALLNQEYKKRFGFIFIVCATGKSAEEMLELLRARIGNERPHEIAKAAWEQSLITKIRLGKL